MTMTLFWYLSFYFIGYEMKLSELPDKQSFIIMAAKCLIIMAAISEPAKHFMEEIVMCIKPSQKYCYPDFHDSYTFFTLA